MSYLSSPDESVVLTSPDGSVILTTPLHDPGQHELYMFDGFDWILVQKEVTPEEIGAATYDELFALSICL